MSAGETHIAEIVSVSTADGVLLGGALSAAASPAALSIDALLFLHGDGGHFYAPLYLGLARALGRAGCTTLLGNRRGHDLVAHGARGGPLAGYAFESVNDSRVDIRAWLDLLVARGHRRVAIGGHSGGAVRAVYAQAKEHFPEVAAVLAVSPGEYRHRTLVEVHGTAFVEAYQQARTSLEQGDAQALRVPGLPWGSMWSAGAYVDCFHPDDRYSVSRHAAATGCPTLFVFGGAECEGPEQLAVCRAACERLTRMPPPGTEVRVIPGANHAYAGREQALYRTLAGWLDGC